MPTDRSPVVAESVDCNTDSLYDHSASRPLRKKGKRRNIDDLEGKERGKVVGVDSTIREQKFSGVISTAEDANANTSSIITRKRRKMRINIREQLSVCIVSYISPPNIIL